jgi:transcriptional regulator with XRE-family HTH domain
MLLGERIRIIRKARSLTQEELGDKIDGISRQSVSDWENGKTTPKLENIKVIAKILKVSYDALLDDNIDLNDQETLISVLSNTLNISKNVKITTKYNLYSSNLSYKYEKLLFFKMSLIVPISIYLIGYIFYTLISVLIMDSVESFNIKMFLIASFGFPIITFISSLFKVNYREFRKGTSFVCGRIENRHLLTFNSKKINNYISVPIDLIEEIKINYTYKKLVGTMNIKVKGRKHPLSFGSLYLPSQVKEVLENIQNTNKEEL